jgi:hypothetical protein
MMNKARGLERLVLGRFAAGPGRAGGALMTKTAGGLERLVLGRSAAGQAGREARR